jgi:hypothetical protein
MSEYTALKPYYATSRIQISKKGHFTQIIQYDYHDQGQKHARGTDYYSYLQNPQNYDFELNLYWENMQYFLDHEKNYINGKVITQEVKHCSIQFRTKKMPFVQWVVEFEGIFNPGLNVYENQIEPDILEYPIYSIYIADDPLYIVDIQTNLRFELDNSHRIVEYFGEKGDVVGPVEIIKIKIP